MFCFFVDEHDTLLIPTPATKGFEGFKYLNPLFSILYNFKLGILINSYI